MTRTAVVQSLVYAAAFSIAVVAAAPSPSLQRERDGAGSARTRRVELPFQGRLRHYRLYVPEAPTGALVLAFHGGGQAAAVMEQITGLDRLADRHHFIVAYPEAFERSWADGRNETPAEKQGVDDVGFAKAVVTDIGRTNSVDGARVFATGLSNGAILAHRLGCDAADVFAAIAPVIGTIAINVARACHPTAAIAVVSIVGVADPSVRFDGSEAGPGGSVLLGSRATEELWRTLNACAPTVTTTALPVLVPDGTSVERRAYAGCRGHADVVWYEIQGGGHRWPPHRFDGSDEVMSRTENGVSSQNLDASDVAWAFFAAHARR